MSDTENIVATRIEAYMVSETNRLWPPNAWNKLGENLFTRRGCTIGAAAWIGLSLLMLFVPPFSGWVQNMAGRPLWSKDLVAVGTMLPALAVLVTFLALVVLSESKAAKQQVWLRYSLIDFTNEYDYVMSDFATMITNIRAKPPHQAEFEVVVLNLPNGDFEFVLYQMTDTLDGPLHPFGENGKAIAIFNGKGDHVNVDQLYELETQPA